MTNQKLAEFLADTKAFIETYMAYLNENGMATVDAPPHYSYPKSIGDVIRWIEPSDKIADFDPSEWHIVLKYDMPSDADGVVVWFIFEDPQDRQKGDQIAVFVNLEGMGDPVLMTLSLDFKQMTFSDPAKEAPFLLFDLNRELTAH
jgi:hypothetical protein